MALLLGKGLVVAYVTEWWRRWESECIGWADGGREVIVVWLAFCWILVLLSLSPFSRLEQLDTAYSF